MRDYVEKRVGGYWLTGSRVALDSIDTAFQGGASPENILRSFPAVGSLVKVNGALTFYLEHQSAVDEYLREQELLAEGLTAQQAPLPKALAERLRLGRESATFPRP